MENGYIIKPRKWDKRIIKPSDCIGCIYNPAKEKKCLSCGNWNNRIDKKGNHLN